MADKLLADRALAALDSAFADEVKRHFAGFVGQVDGDAGKNIATDAEHFRMGLVDLKAAYASARKIVVEVFGEATALLLLLALISHCNTCGPNTACWNYICHHEVRETWGLDAEKDCLAPPPRWLRELGYHA